jgi:hypothetical protein
LPACLVASLRQRRAGLIVSTEIAVLPAADVEGHRDQPPTRDYTKIELGVMVMMEQVSLALAFERRDGGVGLRSQI